MPHLIIVFFLIATAMPAHAETPDIWPQKQGEYIFRWNGLTFGSLAFETETGNARYTLRCRIESRGLLRIFSRHESRSEVSGTAEKLTGGPRRYETFYKSGDKPKRVLLVYDQNGRLAESAVEPPENPQKRPPVPGDLTAGSLDPLTYALAIRAGVRDGLAAGAQAFTLRLYDGRRLMETRVEILGRETLEREGTRRTVIVLEARREPVAGFTAKELSRMKNEPPLYLYFSDDGRLTLLRLQLPLYGSVTADLS